MEEAEIIDMPSDSPSDKHEQLTASAKYIIESWQSHQYQINLPQREATYEVSEVFGFLAYVFEKIRAAVENKAQHIIRRYAIERALLRLDQLKLDEQEKAERLIKELTWSRFLPNRSVTDSKLNALVNILKKYHALIDQHSHQPELKHWIIKLESTEIEELLTPSYLRASLVPVMYHWLRDNFVWQGINLSEEELDLQLYLAAHRALAKADREILSYHLWLLYFPQWPGITEQEIEPVAQKLPDIRQKIEDLLDYPQKNLIFRIVQKNISPFIFLSEILQKSPDPESVLSDPEQLRQATNQVGEEKYSKLRQEINRGIVQSIIYILVTKVTIAMLIEYPYEKYILGEINYLPLAINLLFPPALMYLSTLWIKIPDQRNTDLIYQKLTQLLYQDQKPTKPITIKLNTSDKQRKLSRIFSLLYAYLFIVLTLFTAYLLRVYLNFNAVSIGLFFMFFSLVLLFSFRLKWKAEELLIYKPKQGFASHLISVLSIPFINFGTWLSSSLSQINVITFILDYVIDRPLKSGVNSAEEWTQFLSRKHEEVVEIPEG